MSEKELRETLQEAASRLRYSGDHFHDIGCETRAKSDWDASEACLAEINKIAGTLSPSPERQTMTDEWQPIETAPKDGTRILADWGKYGVQIIYWRTVGMDSGVWLPPSLVPVNIKPTMWMPLPAIAAIKRASSGEGK